MTGKIEDAKNVAMRIVGNTGNDTSESSNSTSNPDLMQLSSSTRSLRPLLLSRSDQLNPSENSIIKMLTLLDTEMEDDAPNSLCTSSAITHTTPSGQTLLHLAAFLGFDSLTRFLVAHGADVDARDYTGFTPLHFAVLAQSRQCVSVLVQAGADLEIVDSRGKTAEEMGPDFFTIATVERQGDADSDSDYWDDEDGDLGDAEEEAELEPPRITKRRVARRVSRPNHSSGKVTPLRSAFVSRSASPPPLAPLAPSHLEMNIDEKADSDANDEKRSFIKKVLAPLLLPDLSAMPWGTLPQIPMVFPVYVPIHWPLFRGAHQKSESADIDTEGKNRASVAQEWREKGVALTAQQTEDVPPPVYTPRVDQQVEIVQSTSVELQEQNGASKRSLPDIRPVGYDSTPVPEQVVFAYQPQAKQGRKIRKKRELSIIPSLALH